jgi:cell division protein FtsI/penicillin-binding protein 2
MTQNERLLEYLQDHGSITSLEAIAHLGIMRCASRIHDLRKDGHDIHCETVKVLNRFGESCGITRYSLAQKKVDHGFAATFMRIFGFEPA